MKKIVFFLVTALMAVTTATAQTWRQSSNSNNHRDDWRYDNQLYYGLRLGLSVSTINSDEERLDAPGSRSGLNLGAVIGYELSSGTPVYLESGLFYTEKGGKYSENGCKLKYNLNYLKLPILLKYNIELEDPFCITPFLFYCLILVQPCQGWLNTNSDTGVSECISPCGAGVNSTHFDTFSCQFATIRACLFSSCQSWY